MSLYKQKKRKNKLSDIFATNKYKLQKLLYNQPVLHINCNGDLIAENCKGILLYTDTEIRLDMGIVVSLRGDDLMLETLDKDRITVSGRFFNFELIYGGVQ